MTDTKASLKNMDSWRRVGFVVLFLILMMVARSVIFLVVVAQAIILLTTGEHHLKLREFGETLGHWVFQTLMFITHNSDVKSFPFDDWPKPSSAEEVPVSPEQRAGEGSFTPIADSELMGEQSKSARSDDIPSFTASVEEEDLGAHAQPQADAEAEADQAEADQADHNGTITSR